MCVCELDDNGSAWKTSLNFIKSKSNIDDLVLSKDNLPGAWTVAFLYFLFKINFPSFGSCITWFHFQRAVFVNWTYSIFSDVFINIIRLNLYCVLLLGTLSYHFHSHSVAALFFSLFSDVKLCMISFMNVNNGLYELFNSISSYLDDIHSFTIF